MDCGISVFSFEEGVNFFKLVPGSNKVGAIVTMDDTGTASSGNESLEACYEGCCGQV